MFRIPNCHSYQIKTEFNKCHIELKMTRYICVLITLLVILPSMLDAQQISAEKMAPEERPSAIVRTKRSHPGSCGGDGSVTLTWIIGNWGRSDSKTYHGNSNGYRLRNLWLEYPSYPGQDGYPAQRFRAYTNRAYRQNCCFHFYSRSGYRGNRFVLLPGQSQSLPFRPRSLGIVDCP